MYSFFFFISTFLSLSSPLWHNSPSTHTNESQQIKGKSTRALFHGPLKFYKAISFVRAVASAGSNCCEKWDLKM